VGQRLRAATVLLCLAWTFRLHRWAPAFVVLAFVAWVLMHWRLEAGLGRVLAQRWGSPWPGGLVIVAALLCASAVAFVYADIAPLAKVMPVALALFGLSVLVTGTWWRAEGARS